MSHQPTNSEKPPAPKRQKVAAKPAPAKPKAGAAKPKPPAAKPAAPGLFDDQAPVDRPIVPVAQDWRFVSHLELRNPER